MLPKTVNVGETTYTINQPKEIEGCLGQINFTEKVINVAKQAQNYKLASEERSDTF